jgi:hypothetical protein
MTFVNTCACTLAIYAHPRVHAWLHACIRYSNAECNTHIHIHTFFLFVPEDTDAIILVAPTADEDRVPYGFVGKMNYIPASLWDNEVKNVYGQKALKECGS